MFTIGITMRRLSHFEYPAFEKICQNWMMIMTAIATHMIGPNGKTPSAFLDLDLASFSPSSGTKLQIIRFGSSSALIQRKSRTYSDFEALYTTLAARTLCGI